MLLCKQPFTVFIDGLNNGIESHLTKYVNDAKIGGSVSSVDGSSISQEATDKLKNDGNLISVGVNGSRLF